MKCRGKAAWYIPLATPSHHEPTLFNRVTSMQKATTVARLKKSKGSDPELKEYVSRFPLLFRQELTFARAKEKVMKSSVGIAPPERFCSTAVVISAPIISLCSTHQHQSDVTPAQKSTPSKLTDQGHTGSNTNSEQDDKQEDNKGEDDARCEDNDEQDDNKEHDNDNDNDKSSDETGSKNNSNNGNKIDDMEPTASYATALIDTYLLS